MFNNKQFRELIVRPALEDIGLYSLDAEELIVGVVAKESFGGTYLAQLGGGPALGICQEEVNTYLYLWNDFLLKHHPDLVNKIKRACNFLVAPAPKELVNNLKFAVIMCRVKFLSIEAPLPPYNNIQLIAEYWKKYYNSEKGKGTVEEFIEAYHAFNK